MSDRMLSDEILLGLIKKNGGGGGGTNNYNNLENLPQIGGVTLRGNKTASDLGLASEDDVAGKQDVLTAGDYISIANDGTISVTQSIGVYDVYSYVVAGRAGNNYYYVDIQKYENGVLRSNTRYVNDQCYDKKIIDDRFSLQYNVGGDFSWHFVLLTDSNEHKEGESIVWRYNVTKDFTETFNVSQDESTDLATKGDVTAALANKQDKTDNALQTTDKTVVGGINELKSGLTNVARNNFGSGVDITAYNTESNMYTFPDDGYLVGFIGNDEIKVKILGATSTAKIEALLNTGVVVSVRKGMRFYVYSNTAGKLVVYVPFA